MESHRRRLTILCRFCGKLLDKHKKGSKYRQATPKEDFKAEFLNNVFIDIDQDSEDVHPKCLCSACRRMLVRCRGATKQGEVIKAPRPEDWNARLHKENCNVCNFPLGRKRKRGKRTDIEIESSRSRPDVDSDTESCSSSDKVESESEQNACIALRTVQKKLHWLDNDTSLVICDTIAKKTGVFVVDPADIRGSINKIPAAILVEVVKEIFEAQKESIKTDISQCKENSKCLSYICEFNVENWLSSRNPIVKAAVDGLTSSRIPPVKQVSAIDHMYSLVQPSFVSPCMFASNLLIYSISRSRMVANVYGKLHPGGLYHTVKTFLSGLTLQVPELPNNDLLVGIDNDQVLVKHWTVRKENRAQVSVLTSVCCAELDDKTYPHLQEKEEFAPR